MLCRLRFCQQVIDALRSADLTAPNAEEEVSRLVMSVRRMCAAIRASLETHIRRWGRDPLSVKGQVWVRVDCISDCRAGLSP